MPFTITDVPPSTTPLVTIAFSGLILLRPGANNTCEIGVHKFTRDHEFHVLLVVERLEQQNPTPPPATVPPRLPPEIVPLLAGPLFAPFSISLDPDPGAGDFMVFARDPFNRVVPPSHPLDYRWAINFKDLHLNLQFNEGVLPVGTLKTGVLYTPHLIPPNLAPTLVRTGSADIPLIQIGSNLAASIDVPINPPGQTKVKFKWQDQGDPVELVLPRDGDDPSKIRYTIYFINEPPAINFEEHSEFLRYYRVIQSGGAAIPEDLQFDLRFAPDERTDEIPCAPAVINP